MLFFENSSKLKKYIGGEQFQAENKEHLRHLMNMIKLIKKPINKDDICLIYYSLNE